MKILKKFKWEAAHRLPRHEGKCRHLHGHSYKMEVELEGEAGADGMVMDFNELKKIIQPLVEQLDHTTVIAGNDEELKAVFEQKNWNYFLLPFDSTAENFCKYFSEAIVSRHSALLKTHNITSLEVRISETDTSWASCKINIQ